MALDHHTFDDLDHRYGFANTCAISCDELVTIHKSRPEQRRGAPSATAPRSAVSNGAAERRQQRRRGAPSAARLSEFDDALRIALQLR